MTVSDEKKMAQVMMQALQPLLQQFGLPPTLFEDLRKIKIKHYEQQIEADTNTVYATVVLEDAESVEHFNEVVSLFIAKLKAKQ